LRAMSTAPCEAWILRLDGGQSWAVAGPQMIEYVVTPRYQRLALCAAHSDTVAFWRDTLVPLVDLPALSGAGAAQRGAIAVLAYQSVPLQPLEYLGLWVAQSPAKALVSDAQGCVLPEQLREPALASLVLSCFEHGGVAVPVLDVQRLASTSFSTPAEPPLADLAAAAAR